jgi:hypothetical protein
MSSLDLLMHQIANPHEIAWNDETYDLALASGLSDAERATLVAKLIENAGLGDTRAILTLGYVQAVEALPMLRAAAKGNEPWAPTARRALVLLGHGAEIVREIAADAAHASATMTRVAAVMCLAKIGGAIAIAALERALADDDYTVRMLAWDGLVEVFDLDRFIRNPGGKRELTTQIELLQVWLGSDFAAFVQMGVNEMRELTRQLAAGATPPSLGIAWAPNPAPEVFGRLRLALFDLEVAFPVDEIAGLTGVTRRWAETMIALRLEGQDPRVPEALVRLGATWTLPVLEEVARSEAISPELRLKVTEGIHWLRAS